MTEKQKVVGAGPKKSVLKNRLKTLAKVGIAAAAVTLGSKVQAAQGSPMRRGYASAQPAEVVTYTQPTVQYVGGAATVDDSRRPIFGQGSRGGMISTIGGRTTGHKTMPRVGGRATGHGTMPHVGGRTGGYRTMPHVGGHGAGHSGIGGRGRGAGFPGAGRGFGSRTGRGAGPRGGGRQMRPRGRGRGF